MNETQKTTKPLKKTIQTIIILLFAFLILVIASFLFYFKWALQSSLNSDTKKVLFEVEKGESSFQVGEHLFERHLIRSDWIYYLNARFKSISFVPGVYDISPSMTMTEISNQIANGETKIIKITFPEGYRREQMGQKLADNDLVTLSTFLDKTEGLEGKLFPDTYYFSPDNTLDEIIEMMKKDFTDRTSELNLTDEDLIIASIVEREADNETERPIIAGIYKNRLKIGMKMEADPTVQYAKDNIAFANLSEEEKKSYKFWRAITNADYKSAVSPYNTFITNALPAGPICSPGLASIKATINYTPTDDLYFIVANGQVYSAKTYEGHRANVTKYLN